VSDVRRPNGLTDVTSAARSRGLHSDCEASSGNTMTRTEPLQPNVQSTRSLMCYISPSAIYRISRQRSSVNSQSEGRRRCEGEGGGARSCTTPALEPNVLSHVGWLYVHNGCGNLSPAQEAPPHTRPNCSARCVAAVASLAGALCRVLRCGWRCVRASMRLLPLS